jgi:hypothetical protein
MFLGEGEGNGKQKLLRGLLATTTPPPHDDLVAYLNDIPVAL